MLSILLTNCGTYCTACRSFIENTTNEKIYIIIEPSSQFSIKSIEYSASESNIKHYMIDTIRNVGTFEIPGKCKLLTYSGPGLEPAYNLKRLKIITRKKIIDFTNSNDIETEFKKNGAVFTIQVE